MVLDIKRKNEKKIGLNFLKILTRCRQKGQKERKKNGVQQRNLFFSG